MKLKLPGMNPVDTLFKFKRIYDPNDLGCTYSDSILPAISFGSSFNTYSDVENGFINSKDYDFLAIFLSTVQAELLEINAQSKYRDRIKNPLIMERHYVYPGYFIRLYMYDSTLAGYEVFETFKIREKMYGKTTKDYKDTPIIIDMSLFMSYLADQLNINDMLEVLKHNVLLPWTINYINRDFLLRRFNQSNYLSMYKGKFVDDIPASFVVNIEEIEEEIGEDLSKYDWLSDILKKDHIEHRMIKFMDIL